VLRHTSISRVHSAILVDAELGVILLDLVSKAGTKLADKALNACIPMQVKSGQKINFGLSTRTYEVHIDYSKMQKAVEIEKKNLEREMRVLERLDRPDLDTETLKSTLGLVKEDTVYVSNLPFSCTEKDLSELFADCGAVTSIRLPENRQTK
jgi:RNA recognition motif. (a.k.a. RRM, RBD, or RNP domain)/FHA domain